MKKIMWFFWVPIFVFLVLFVITLELKNDNLVQINYYFGFQREISVSLLLVVPFLIGVLSGVILMGFTVFKHKRRFKAEKRKLTRVEKEVENLRALPLKDEV